VHAVVGDGNNFVLGKNSDNPVEIKGFRVSCRASRWRAGNTGYTGVVVYDIGKCCGRSWNEAAADATCKKIHGYCSTMRNGYAIIFDTETLAGFPKNQFSRHSAAVRNYFGGQSSGITPKVLRKYGMRFGGFSVKKDGRTGLGSGTLNTIGTGTNKLYGMNAYEAGIMIFLVNEWKAKGPAKTYMYPEVDRYFRQQKNYDDVINQFGYYKVTLTDQWKETYKPK